MSLFDSLRETSLPTAAVELSAHQVAAAAIDRRSGSPHVAAYAAEPLPPGALVPSLTSANVHNRAEVASALDRVLEGIGRPRRIGLVVPDVVAKVSLVRFEQVPARVQDLDQVVRWQVRKSAPFSIDEAQVSYVAGIRAEDGQEFIVSVAKRAVVEEYEGLCADAGAQAGIVDLSTFNVVNAVLASSRPPHGDWLLVNVAADYASIAIVRGDHLIFFRNRAADTEGTLADLVHQTAMYHEDRLGGGGFERVFVTGGAVEGVEGIDQVRRSLQERFTTRVEGVDPRSAATLTDRISAPPALLDALAPLVGLLLRGQGAAA